MLIICLTLFFFAINYLQYLIAKQSFSENINLFIFGLRHISAILLFPFYF